MRYTFPKYVFCFLFVVSLTGCGDDEPTGPGIPDNNVPVAEAGADRTVSMNTLVKLNGLGSADADGDSLTYAWTLDAPSGSKAALSNMDGVSTTFPADVMGDYTVTLTVSDGKDEDSDEVVITAEEQILESTSK